MENLNSVTNVNSLDSGCHMVTSGSHLSEPELCDKNVNMDDVLASITLSCQVTHGQFQYCR